MRRIRLDFTLTAEDVKAQLRKQIPDLTAEEFTAWDAAGLLERKTIDGETRYFKRSPSNLFRLSAQAAARRARQFTLQRRSDGKGECAPSRNPRPGDPKRQDQRGAAPRPRDLFDRG